MTTPRTFALSAVRSVRVPREDLAVALATAAAFVLLFWRPLALLASDWVNDPEAGHGLLLAPLAILIAWRTGFVSGRGQHMTALIAIAGAVLLRFLAELAAEPFTMRASMILALMGITWYYLGLRQVAAWGLSFALVALSVPLPDVILGAIALPLQLLASKLGASLLDARHVPVALAGNIIHLPGQDLFVTEACSGLRSLSALLSLAILLAGTTLRTFSGRALLVALAIPIAIVVNAIRVFVTGYSVFYVGPEAGEGVLHFTEGWFLFVIAFAGIASLTGLLAVAERHLRGEK